MKRGKEDVEPFSKEEAEIFKEYLGERICYFCELYVDYLNQNHKTIPQEVLPKEELNDDTLIVE